MNDDRMVGAIAEKIANGENIEYNPVYFCSKCGIKEDFLDEIGMKYQEKHPGDTVIRTSSEDFVAGLILHLGADGLPYKVI